jgi:hypothetical protein
MLKKSILFLVFAALLISCKGKNESDGDSYYKKGKFRNAVNSYVEARKKGKISDEFYDSFVVAYASSAKQTAQKNASDGYIGGCVEQIYKNLPSTKKSSTLDSVVVALTDIGVAQIKGDYEYEYTLQGFRNIDSALAIAKRGNVSGEYAKKARKDMESTIIKRAIENAEGADLPVAAEYTLLEAEVFAPDNAELKKTLNNVRLKNRSDLLIFEAVGIEKPSRFVNKYGYIIAFPSINIGPTGTTAEVVVWNSTGNNVDFDFSKLKMVSTKGETASAKVGGGSCYMSDHLGKKKGPLKGSVGKLLSELTCLVNISYSYPNGFIPDYVDYKDANNNLGRKYLGYK